MASYATSTVGWVALAAGVVGVVALLFIAVADRMTRVLDAARKDCTIDEATHVLRGDAPILEH